MGYETLRLSYGEVTAEVVPARGGLVTSLRVGKADVLFLDHSTLDDPTKNVRGGIPVLFPYAGRLVDDVFVHASTKMKQHGFGRNKPWALQEAHVGSMRLGLVQDAETRAQYPYEYDVDYRIHLLVRGLQVEMMIHNRGNRPLPVSPGWHPYFRCPARQKARLRGDPPGLAAQRMSDESEFDFGLEAPVTGRTRFEVPGLGVLHLSFSPLMRHMQFWSQPGRDFVCLEPFFGPNNTVNTDRRLDIPPGQARELWMRTEVDPRA